MPTWPSPRSERLGTPNPPAIRFARGTSFGASRFTHLLRPAKLLALLYGSDRCTRPPRAFTSRLSTARSPSTLLDMTTTATGLLCWQDSHPLEWQLASLHQNRTCGFPAYGLYGTFFVKGASRHLDGSRSPRSRPHLQPMTEQDEDEKHGRCFIELVAFEEKGGANAEDVARPDAEEDQHCHVENSVPECPDGGDDERPCGIEDCRAGKKEQPEVESQPEWGRWWGKHVAHGRVNEDRHCEHEAVVRHWHSGCCRSGGRGRFVRGVTDMHAVLVNGTWFADMLGHDLAGAVEAALVDLGLERRHTRDALIILDCHAVRGDGGGHALDPEYPAELLLDGLVVQRGQHAANVKSGCFHTSLLSLMSAGVAAFTWKRRRGPSGRAEAVSLRAKRTAITLLPRVFSSRTGSRQCAGRSSAAAQASCRR